MLDSQNRLPRRPRHVQNNEGASRIPHVNRAELERRGGASRRTIALRPLVLAIGFIALAACSSMMPRPQQLPYPPQRVFQNAYSFMPPHEPGWLVLARDAHRLAFARHGSNPDETYGIQGRLFRLPAYGSSEEFVQIIRQGLAAEADDKRFQILKHDVSADTSQQTSCARSHFVAEDSAAVKRTSTPGTMILEVMTLSCAHPKNRDFAVTLVYSHRYYPGQADATFAETATRLLSSLEFLE